MECKVLRQFEEVGVLQWEDAKYLQNEIHHPHWVEWLIVWRKGLPNHLQIYDTGQQEEWLHWFLLSEYSYYPKVHIFLSRALCLNDRMHNKKSRLLWLLRREFGQHMLYLMSMYLLLFVICLMSLHVNLLVMYLMFMYCLVSNQTIVSIYLPFVDN